MLVDKTIYFNIINILIKLDNFLCLIFSNVSVSLHFRTYQISEISVVENDKKYR